MSGNFGKWKTKLAVLGGALALGLVFWWGLFLRGYGEVVLATGQSGGTYTVLGEGFGKFVERSGARVAIKTLGSEGTVENLRRLAEGEADFAFVQSGRASSEKVRVVAKLYTEVLHILLPSDSEVRSLVDLSGKKLSLGEAGSGSRMVGLDLLGHFGVTGYEEVALSPEESLAALRKGELDAVFLVTALQSDVVRRGVEDGAVKFLSLPEANAGLVARFPYLVTAEVPAMTYPCGAAAEGAMPNEGVATVGVASLLVCRAELSAGLVYQVTRKLFASRNELSQRTPEAYQIAEISSGELLPWAVHEGAQRYYKRREPGFLERYAEVLAFLMSLAAAGWAVWGTVSKWSSRKKKNRIDDYYLEVAAAFVRLERDDLSLESLAEERSRLRRLRSSAFQDLAAEKLKADDSFEIFQNQVALCLDDVRRREERLQK